MATVRSARPSGRVHTCSVCRKRALWGPGWGYYDIPTWSQPGELPDGLERYIICSGRCEERLFDEWHHHWAERAKRLAFLASHATAGRWAPFYPGEAPPDGPPAR